MSAGVSGEFQRVRVAQAHQKRRAVRRRQAAEGELERPPVYRLDGQLHASSILQLQSQLGNAAYNRAASSGAPIQRLFGRKKRPGPADDELKSLKGKGSNQAATAMESAAEPKSNTGENVQEGVGFGAEVTGVPGDALSNFGSSTDKLNGDESIEFTGSTAQAGLSGGGSLLGAAGAGLTAAGGITGFILAIQDLRELSQKTAAEAPTKRWDQASVYATLVGAGSQTILGGLQTAAGVTGAGANAAAAAGKDAGSTVADVASGAMDSLGALGGIVEVGVSAAQGVVGLGKLISGKQWDADLASGAAMDFLSALKGVAVTAKSCIGAANTFMSVAGQAIAVLPVIGAAVNIVAQMIDVLVRVVDIVMRVYRIVKNAIRQKTMNAFAAAKGVASEAGKFAAGMAINARKRWRRQITPLIASCTHVVADFISIGGSVLNIIGAATAAAYGAGVGIMAAGYAATATAGVLKTGAALAKPAQGLVRWGKQKIRDKGETSARMHSFGKGIGINMDRTTKAKQNEIAGQITFIMKHLHDLKDLPAPGDKDYAERKAEYEDTYKMVKFTGVSVKELQGAADREAVIKLFATAMRDRG